MDPDRVPTRRSRAVPLLAGAVVTAVVLLLAVALGQYLGGRDNSAVLGSPTPNPSPSPSVSPTASPSATPSAAAGVFGNEALGYRMKLPSERWRHSECLSGTFTGSDPQLGHDTFTLLSASEEQSIEMGETGGRALMWTINVLVERNARGLSAADWFAQRPAGSVGQRVENVTIGGRPAVKVTNGVDGPVAYFIAADGRIFIIALSGGTEPAPPEATPSAVEAVASSLEVFAPRATATPAPAIESARPVVDALASAFAAKDADALAKVIVPRCWFTTAAQQAGAGARDPKKVIDGLRQTFADGSLRVAVQRDTLKQTAPGRAEVRADWTQGPSTVGAALMLTAMDGRWYWVGVIYDRFP